MAGTLHMRLGENLGELLLEIAQTNISKGNIDKAFDTYIEGLCGFTKEYAMMLLKNKAVLKTSEDGIQVEMVDDMESINKNAKNIFDWYLIINNRIKEIQSIRDAIINTEDAFSKLYNGKIDDYSIIDMMKRYFSDEELSKIGIHNIAARIIGAEDGKICDKGNSNPMSIWNKLEDKMTYEDEDTPAYTISKYDRILYYTVNYVKLIKMLHKAYLNFEPTYKFLVDEEFIKRQSQIENFIENTLSVLVKFMDTSTGYYHPLCNTDLYEYKEKLASDICKTYYGGEYMREGIIKKNIMDGYDAGWLSPDGEFYGANGETSSMIHMNIAENIFDGNNKYAIKMAKDGVSIFGGVDSPDYWLEKHGWIKIHHNDCYGSFIGRRDETPTPDFPYAYNPTTIQIKMICDYADKFYGGKFYTEANAFGRTSHPDPYTTYKVRQMDEFKIHEIFGR